MPPSPPGPSDPARARVAAVVLAGGRSRRFGSDKLAADVEGRPLLDRALHAALAITSRVVVVGPDIRTWPIGVTVVREDPPYAGPYAAVMAAISDLARDAAPLDVVLVLAGDLLDPAPMLPRLLAALADGPEDLDAAVAVDAQGHRQPLLAAYRLRSLLAAATAADAVDRPARHLVEGRELVEVLDDGGWSRDVDTPGDLP